MSEGGKGVLVFVAGVRLGVFVGSGVIGVEVDLGVLLAGGVVFWGVGDTVFVLLGVD